MAQRYKLYKPARYWDMWMVLDTHDTSKGKKGKPIKIHDGENPNHIADRKQAQELVRKLNNQR